MKKKLCKVLGLHPLCLVLWPAIYESKLSYMSCPNAKRPSSMCNTFQREKDLFKVEKSCAEKPFGPVVFYARSAILCRYWTCKFLI